MQDLSKIGEISELQIDANRSIRYLKTGNGDPLILLHTIRTQLDYFEEVIPQLAKHFTVYAIDLPGHGYSSIDTKANYDEPYFRSAVIAFIEKLDLNKVTLVGESIGAVLALTVASQLPDRVIKVISSNAYDYDLRYGDGVRRGNLLANFVIGQFAIPYVGAVVAAMENILFLGIILKGGLRNKRWMPGKLLKEFDRVGRRKGYRHVERSTFAGWQSWSKARSMYAAVKVPVILIYGEYDWSTIVERKRTAKELGGVAINTIANTGHFAFVDNPHKLVELAIGT
ncbi:MAG: alpha/beta fold hydrolase [Methylophilaceae bacterium]